MRLLWDEEDAAVDSSNLVSSFDHSTCLSVFLRRLRSVDVCLRGDSTGCDSVFDAFLFSSPPLPLILEESIFSPLLELLGTLRHILDI